MRGGFTRPGERPRRPVRAAIRAMFWVALLLALAPFAYSLYVCPSLAPYRSGYPGTTRFMEFREHRAAQLGKTFTLQYQPVPRSKWPRGLDKMVIGAEDARFLEHHGFDWEAIRHARAVNKRRGRVVLGGSTITQQLAKNLWLTPERKWWRKIVEAILTLRLEAALPKDRILELYVNVIEWGDGVFGIEAAARRYYGVPAARLSADQTATLVAAIPSPIKFSARNPSGRVRRVRDRLLGRGAEDPAETGAQGTPKPPGPVADPLPGEPYYDEEGFHPGF